MLVLIVLTIALVMLPHSLVQLVALLPLHHVSHLMQNVLKVHLAVVGMGVAAVPVLTAHQQPQAPQQLPRHQSVKIVNGSGTARPGLSTTLIVGRLASAANRLTTGPECVRLPTRSATRQHPLPRQPPPQARPRQAQLPRREQPQPVHRQVRQPQLPHRLPQPQPQQLTADLPVNAIGYGMVVRGKLLRVASEAIMVILVTTPASAIIHWMPVVVSRLARTYSVHVRDTPVEPVAGFTQRATTPGKPSSSTVPGHVIASAPLTPAHHLRMDAS